MAEMWGRMRAKILEGMAVGKVVLSTHLGMEGIEAQHKRECLLADTPDEFAEAVRWCMAQGKQLVDLGRRAEFFCAAHYDNLRVAEKLLANFRELTNLKTVEVLPNR